MLDSRVVGRGQEGPLCDLDLSYTTGRESESSTRMINGMGEKIDAI